MATLVIVGTGIQLGQMSAEAREWLCGADKVLYCVSDAATERAILLLNKTAESLYSCYGEGKIRTETYSEMVSRTLDCLEQVNTLAVAYYGHPGFYVSPSHRSILQARERGHHAFMLPAVSSFDCLIADLGINIASGCQIYEATDLMIRERKIDVASHLVIMQVSSLGDVRYSYGGFDHRYLDSLRTYLLAYYPETFEVISYYASQFSVTTPRIDSVALKDLSVDLLKSIATLYVPPLRNSAIHLARLREYQLDDYIMRGRRLVPLNLAAEDERL